MVSGGRDMTNQLEVEDMIYSPAVMEKKVQSIALMQPKGDTVTPDCENINPR
jgi:hypothetical protein